MEQNIFSLLSDDEKTLMERYIDDYSYGNCDRTASLEYILRYWTKNKAHLVEKFGGQLILKKTFSYQIPDAQLQNEYNFAIPDKCRSYMSTLWTRIFNMCYKLAVPDPDPSHPTYFGNTGYFFDKSNLIHQKFTPENGEPADFLLPDGTTLRANPGDKNIRVLNKLAKAFGKGKVFGVLLALPVFKDICRFILGVGGAGYRSPELEVTEAPAA